MPNNSNSNEYLSVNSKAGLIESHSSFSHIIQIRIIKDSNNKDGWIGKQLSTGKICFFANLNNKISNLIAGQIWEGKIIKSGPRYHQVILLDMAPETN